MTIFSRIIKGEIPCYKIAENEKFFAFLDLSPLTKGHTLVVPKLSEPEANYIFDLSDDILSEMLVFAKKIAVAQKKVIDCKRIGVAVLGMEVPHVHLHLVPLHTEKDLLFSNPRLKIEPEEMEQIAKAITDSIEW